MRHGQIIWFLILLALLTSIDYSIVTSAVIDNSSTTDDSAQQSQSSSILSQNQTAPEQKNIGSEQNILSDLKHQLEENSRLVPYLLLVVSISSMVIAFLGLRRRGRLPDANINLKPDNDDEKDVKTEKISTPTHHIKLVEVLDIRPPPKNPNFTGRNEILQNISKALSSGVSACVINGTGGMGKTQVAAAYLYRHRVEYKYCWWLPSEDPAVLKSHYASIRIDLGSEPDFPKAACTDIPSTVSLIKRWLEKDHGWKWLLVLDNAKDPEDIDEYIPREGGAGHMIITSRDASSAWDNAAYSYQLEEFELDEAVDFLIKRTAESDREGAKAVAVELGCLPLALEQAGAYIKNNNRTFSHYMMQLRGDKMDALSQFKPTGYPEPVSRTWNISFDKVQKETPLSANILCICSYLASEQIPLNIMDLGIEYLDQPAPTSSNVNKAITALKHYSLVTGESGSLSIHKLVQDVIRYKLGENGQAKWSEVAVKLIDGVFSYNEGDSQTWAECAILLPHALAATKYAEEVQVASEAISHLLNQVGLYLEEMAEFSKAKGLLERALKIDEKIYGLDHPNVARDINNLGGVLRDLAELEEARKYFERALKIDEKIYGPDHLNVAIDVNNLGLILQDLGGLQDARDCYERALKIDGELCGPDHPEVAIDINNLGSVLKDLSELQEARKCFERALKIGEKVYGPDHPCIATYINNLGRVLNDLGELDEAMEYLERALKIDEKVYGPDHPNVARRANNLGSVLQDLGKLQNARECYERSLKIFRTRLGENHPNTNLVKAKLDLLNTMK